MRARGFGNQYRFAHGKAEHTTKKTKGPDLAGAQPPLLLLLSVLPGLYKFKGGGGATQRLGSANARPVGESTSALQRKGKEGEPSNAVHLGQSEVLSILQLGLI